MNTITNCLVNAIGNTDNIGFKLKIENQQKKKKKRGPMRLLSTQKIHYLIYFISVFINGHGPKYGCVVRIPAVYACNHIYYIYCIFGHDKHMQFAIFILIPAICIRVAIFHV